MKKLLITLLLLAALPAFADPIPAPSTPRLINEHGYISDSNPLAVSAQLDLEGATLETAPVFADQAGKSATATIDAGHRAVVNIGSETIGLKSAVQGVPSEFNSRKVSLAANTAQNISSTLAGSRLYIEITATSGEAEFWVDFGKTAVINGSRRVVGGIGIKLPKTTDISVIASESTDIFILEGGQ